MAPVVSLMLRYPPEPELAYFKCILHGVFPKIKKRPQPIVAKDERAQGAKQTEGKPLTLSVHSRPLSQQTICLGCRRCEKIISYFKAIVNIFYIFH